MAHFLRTTVPARSCVTFLLTSSPKWKKNSIYVCDSFIYRRLTPHQLTKVQVKMRRLEMKELEKLRTKQEKASSFSIQTLLQTLRWDDVVPQL